MRKRFFRILLFIAIGFGLSELFARYYLELGTPLLSVKHPTIEYMLKPNQSVSRSGKRILINKYGMRSGHFDAQREKGEYRMMVFGDSIINGGNQTDQGDLATTLVEKTLAGANRKVVVGNISADSWGPGNWLAYARAYGFFDADVIVLVISSHDSSDNPKFGALDENSTPTRNPYSAVIDAMTRHIHRYFAHRRENADRTEPSAPNELETAKGIGDLKHFLELAKSQSKTVLVVQHWQQDEVRRGYADIGNRQIKEACDKAGVPTISLDATLRGAIETGNNPYRDNIHPNESGQKLIAEAILKKLGRHPPERLANLKSELDLKK